MPLISRAAAKVFMKPSLVERLFMVSEALWAFFSPLPCEICLPYLKGPNTKKYWPLNQIQIITSFKFKLFNILFDHKRYICNSILKESKLFWLIYLHCTGRSCWILSTSEPLWIVSQLTSLFTRLRTGKFWFKLFDVHV